MKRKPLIAGNWKMNGTRASVANLLEELTRAELPDAVEFAVCPPYIYLPLVAEQLAHSEMTYGAQNVCHLPDGAVTGEISLAMLQEYQCRYVILGHSERRAIFHESNDWIAKKVAMTLEQGLSPILCVGETEAERDNGQTMGIIQAQLAVVLQIAHNLANLQALVIAYEPVWAIGTGKTATPEQAQEVHAFIREQVRQAAPDYADGLRILYGGSMKPDNAADLLAMPDIDGGLIGGASLNAEQFLQIGQQCNKLYLSSTC